LILIFRYFTPFHAYARFASPPPCRLLRLLPRERQTSPHPRFRRAAFAMRPAPLLRCFRFAVFAAASISCCMLSPFIVFFRAITLFHADFDAAFGFRDMPLRR